VTRPYERYAPEGKRICCQNSLKSASPTTTHKHDTRITVTTQVVNVEHANLTTTPAMHAVNRFDTAADLGLTLLRGPLELLERRALQTRKGRAGLIDCDAVLLEAVDEGWAEDACGDVAALVAGLVGALVISHGIE
jgi:hypothetical protein